MDRPVQDTLATLPMARHVSLRSLRTFCVAARHHSFKLAAEELFISASAVSHQVRDLESQIDTRLFERQTRSLMLTPYGRALFDQVEPLLRRIYEVLEQFDAQPRRQTLRLALMPFFATELFIPNLHLFVAENPMVDLRIETTAIRLVQHRVDADASILLAPEPPEGLVAQPLCPLRLVAACAPSLKQSLGLRTARQLAEDSSLTLIVSRSHPDSWNDWFAAAGIARPLTHRILNLDNTAAVALAAEKGLGIALLPVPTGRAWLRSGALESITDDAMPTGERYFLVYRPEDAERGEMRALRDWAVRQFAGLA